jgi:hypothetical protein
VAVYGEDQELSGHLVVGLHGDGTRDGLEFPATIVACEVRIGVEQGGVRDAVEPQVFVFLVDGDGSVAGIPQVDFFDEEGLQRDNAQVLASGGELVDGVDDSRVEALAQIRVRLATFFDVRSFNDEKI